MTTNNGGMSSSNQSIEASSESTDRVNSTSLIEHLKHLSQEYFAFYPTSVKVTNDVPTAHLFASYLSANTPILFKNAVSHWPAIRKWGDDYYLSSKLRDDKITVAVTPEGYADAIVDDTFYLPLEETMTMADFLERLRDSSKKSVYYIQHQNSSLFREFNNLLPDVEADIPWATKAIGQAPNAVNFWMGEERAVTSMHNDNYENIYCVVKGKKSFLLHAPIDTPFIPYKKCVVSQYMDSAEDSYYEYVDKEVEWILIDPLNPDFSKYPLYENAHAFHVEVHAGDALYIPSLWYHHERQSHGCIAVNYWYDMLHNSNYCYFNYLTRMSRLLHPL